MISRNWLAGNFADCKILNPWYKILGELARQGRGTGFQSTRQVLQQMQCPHREHGFDTKCPELFAGLREHWL
jgi:hypothetical protein